MRPGSRNTPAARSIAVVAIVAVLVAQPGFIFCPCGACYTAHTVAAAPSEPVERPSLGCCHCGGCPSEAEVASTASCCTSEGGSSPSDCKCCAKAKHVAALNHVRVDDGQAAPPIWMAPWMAADRELVSSSPSSSPDRDHAASPPGMRLHAFLSVWRI